MEKEELLVEFLKNMGLDYRIDEGVTYKEYVIKSYYRNGNEMSFDFKKENGNLIFMGIYGSEDYE